VEEKNAHQDERTIDLHELHVVEALTCLESFIVENIRGTIYRSVGSNGTYHRVKKGKNYDKAFMLSFYSFNLNENSIFVYYIIQIYMNLLWPFS
jgi:hypothetical protein